MVLHVIDSWDVTLRAMISTEEYHLGLPCGPKCIHELSIMLGKSPCEPSPSQLSRGAWYSSWLNCLSLMVWYSRSFRTDMEMWFPKKLNMVSSKQ
jgi:hypothetical protein